jgi:uncharacterized protein
MYRITIRFYEELNDFLPRDMRKRDIEHCFTGKRSVKDLVESMGVPHVEVDLILVNGESVGFDYLIEDGDRISVYPVFESFDIAGTGRLRPEPLREVRFVLDVHLRKLARQLRLLGFDVDYSEHRDDPELAEISSREGRALLTRDRRLLMRRIVTRGIIIRNTDPERQVLEVLERLQLSGMCRPFTRCIECNGGMEELEYGSDAYSLLEGNIPEGVRAWCREFYRCRDCGRLYWKGSHYDRLRARVEKILGSGSAG